MHICSAIDTGSWSGTSTAATWMGIVVVRAARDAGIYVPDATRKRCIDYVKKSQNPDGGFRYTLRSSGSSFALSGAGLVALYSAGIYEGPEITAGLKYLMQFLPEKNQVRHETYYYYAQYYAVQAMWQAGGDHWQRWYPAIRDELLGRQKPEGYWLSSEDVPYGTAMACIVLQMPNNYLPIFQR